ncbi:hypothetical protein M4I21_05930 [Cellulophaga sp. 20_2_10]|uniref:hypothetical protein n=1 Tax=Cellulophaga sp. 20_2_10 TaxID=2942476 RepID=UPI00201AA1E1|nr:hypothetical protein [Cellulophaga sp. 20_2_10]MCL5245338.1 hypothetical protein [Cellulophaga sp. 20_2_10]
MNKLLIIISILFLNIGTKEHKGLNSKIEISTEDIHLEGATNVNRNILYKGTLNGKTKISLYLNEQEHPCGGEMTLLNAMYKYDNQKKWLLLNTTTDIQKKKYCMVEDNFTGALFLEEEGDYLRGNWVSPDTKQKYEVELKKVDLNKIEKDKLDEILFDDLLYSKNDC